jgi:hypothetical protein
MISHYCGYAGCCSLHRALFSSTDSPQGHSQVLLLRTLQNVSVLRTHPAPTALELLEQQRQTWLFFAADLGLDCPRLLLREQRSTLLKCALCSIPTGRWNNRRQRKMMPALASTWHACCTWKGKDGRVVRWDGIADAGDLQGFPQHIVLRQEQCSPSSNVLPSTSAPCAQAPIYQREQALPQCPQMCWRGGSTIVIAIGGGVGHNVGLCPPGPLC